MSKQVVRAMRDGELQDRETWDFDPGDFSQVVLEANGHKIRLPDVTPTMTLQNEGAGFFFFAPESKNCILNASLKFAFSPIVVGGIDPATIVQTKVYPNRITVAS